MAQPPGMAPMPKSYLAKKEEQKMPVVQPRRNDPAPVINSRSKPKPTVAPPRVAPVAPPRGAPLRGGAAGRVEPPPMGNKP